MYRYKDSIERKLYICHPDCRDICALILPQTTWPLRRVLWLPEARAVVATSCAIHCLLVANVSESQSGLGWKGPKFPYPLGISKGPTGSWRAFRLPLNFTMGYLLLKSRSRDKHILGHTSHWHLALMFTRNGWKATEVPAVILQISKRPWNFSRVGTLSTCPVFPPHCHHKSLMNRLACEQAFSSRISHVSSFWFLSCEMLVY